MGKITVVGSSNTDMIMQLENIPRPGETLLGNKFSTA
ncbi:MAG: ribokinase, partial [archaeon]|nr:ribokinase [archaeon]